MYVRSYDDEKFDWALNTRPGVDENFMEIRPARKQSGQDAITAIKEFLENG